MRKISNKRIVIFGGGVVGRAFVEWLPNDYDCRAEIIAFVDNNINRLKSHIYGIPVYSPVKLKELVFDYIIIASDKEDYISEMKIQLYKLNIEEAKILSGMEIVGWNIEILARYNWIKQIASWINTNNILGNVAECGVYRGDCAKFINVFFNNKKIYLFDTFEGFTEKDLAREISFQDKAFLDGIFCNNTELFDDTNIEKVMQKMEHPENVIIKKGWFPESTIGVDDRFCFVNLDMDLYQPILSGLEYFWNRMEQGGYILIHDYFNPALPGVVKAVQDFEIKYGYRLNKFPIGDKCSIAIIK